MTDRKPYLDPTIRRFRPWATLRLPRPGTAEPSFHADPTPHPLGCPWGVARPGETPEARAFRRFPIKEHKPG